LADIGLAESQDISLGPRLSYRFQPIQICAACLVLPWSPPRKRPVVNRVGHYLE